MTSVKVALPLHLSGTVITPQEKFIVLVISVSVLFLWYSKQGGHCGIWGGAVEFCKEVGECVFDFVLQIEPLRKK